MIFVFGDFNVGEVDCTNVGVHDAGGGRARENGLGIQYQRLLLMLLNILDFSANTAGT